MTLNYTPLARRQGQTYRQLLDLVKEASENKGIYLWVSGNPLRVDVELFKVLLEPIKDIVNFKLSANRIEIGESVIMLASYGSLNKNYERFRGLTFKTRIDHEVKLSNDVLMFLESRNK